MTANEKLLAWRKKKGLTQREAAALTGVSQPAWQAYENSGIPKTPAATAIERVTDGFVSVNDWVESEETRAVRRARAASKRVRSRKGTSASSPPRAA